jgi:L-amino acid N-acyltransferase YncA
MNYIIERMQPADWAQVRTIYEAGIATGLATFETWAPDWAQWDADHLTDCRLVARADDTVIGWAALLPISRRQVYVGVAEVSVYVAPNAQGQGVGNDLLAGLILASEHHALWTLQASVFPENKASLALHRKHGFREIGRRERIARLRGVWRDTILLERRSRMVGIEQFT